MTIRILILKKVERFAWKLMYLSTYQLSNINVSMVLS